MEDNIPNDITATKSDVIARLAHAFILFSLKDGEQASHAVSTALASTQMSISKCQQLAADQPEILSEIQAMNSQISDGIVSLQFYDRVSQRLDHAVRCIKTLESVGLNSNLDDSFDLHVLLQLLTMEDERVLFKAIEEGATMEHALELAAQSLKNTVQDSDDNIELF